MPPPADHSELNEQLVFVRSAPALVRGRGRSLIPPLVVSPELYRRGKHGKEPHAEERHASDERGRIAARLVRNQTKVLAQRGMTGNGQRCDPQVQL